MRKAVEVEIRPLAETDLTEMAVGLGRDHARYFRRKLPLQRAGQGLVLAAFHRARPVGALLTLWDEPAEERRLRSRLPGVPLIYHVHVTTRLRCRGIGTQLLAVAHDELRARGHRQVALGVDCENKDARRLYERLGYDQLSSEGWGKGARRYVAMALDLEHHDRTRVLRRATPAGPRPQDLDGVISQLLGDHRPA